MSDEWEDAPSGEWEDAKGWESPAKSGVSQIVPHDTPSFSSDTLSTKKKDEVAKEAPGMLDWLMGSPGKGKKEDPSLTTRIAKNQAKGAAGLAETGLNLGTGMAAFAMGLPVVGQAALKGDKHPEKEWEAFMDRNTYQPRTEYGKEYSKVAGDLINEFGMPMMGLHLGTPEPMRGVKERAAPKVDLKALDKGWEDAPAKADPDAFWKQRAEQLQQDAQTADKPGALFVDKYGQAMDEGQFKQHAQERDARTAQLEQLKSDRLRQQLENGEQMQLPLEQEAAPKAPEQTGLPLWDKAAENERAAAEKMTSEAKAKEELLGQSPEVPGKAADVERAHQERQQQLESGKAEESKLAREDELSKIQEDLLQGKPVARSRFANSKRQRGAVNIIDVGDGFKAMLGDKLIGYLKDNLPRGMAKAIGENANIDIVKVDPEHRGTGVGKALYQAFNEKHEGNIAPSGKTTADAWKVWKRDYPSKVDDFVSQEAARVRDGADPRLVIGNITDPAIAQRVLTEATKGKQSVPAGQRGALLFGSGEPKSSKVSAYTKDSPEVKEAQAKLNQEKKQQVVADILKNPLLDAYTSRIDTPEKVIAEAPGAKDIGPTQAKKASTVSPGINSVAISSNNPLLKYTREAISRVVRDTAKLTRDYVTGADGFGAKLKRLSQEEQNQVVAALQLADRKQRTLTAEELSKNGFNTKQIDFIQHVQKMDEVKLDIWNKARAELGLPLVDKREGHFAGNFSGDYRTLVLDKDKNVVGVVTSATSHGNRAIQKKVLEKHPDVSFADTKRMGLSGSSAKANIFTGMQDIMDVLAKGDPRFAKIQEVVDAAIKDRGDSLYGASLHADAKKGIWGNEGNKFWKDTNTNTKEALKAFVDYWESGISSHLNLTTEVKLKELMDNPALDHMPRAKQYVDNYIKQFTGRSLGTLGDALNTILDTPGRWTGLGPSVVRDAVQQFNKRASQLTMGFLNPLFLVTQAFQVPQMAFPELTKIQSSLGMDPVKFAAATSKAVADGLKMAHEEITGKPANLSEFTRGAYQYAKDNGLMTFSEFNNARDIFQGKASKAVDTAADYLRTKAEQATRPYVFFAAVEMLKDSGMSPKEVYDTAYHLTQHSMVDYHASEKPMMYSRLGVLGGAAGSLQTFKHAYLGQLGTFIKDAAKGNPGPLVAAAVAMFTFSGLKGTPFYQEADELVKALTDKFYKNRKSIADIAMKNLPEWAKSGVLSTSTGVNMQSRLSTADVLPNSPTEAVSPFMSLATKIGQAGADVVKNNDKLAWSNLAKEAAPSGTIKGMVETGLKTNEKGQTINRRGEVDYPRTEFDTAVRKWTGGTSLEESLNKEKLYNDQLNMKSRKEGQKEVTAKGERMLAQGILTEESMKKLVADYQKEKGDPQQLVSALVEYAKTVKLTGKQRMEGIPGGSLSSIYKYENYNDR